MKSIILRRSDFKPLSDGSSIFDYIISLLDPRPDCEWKEIEEIKIFIDTKVFNISKQEGEL